MGFEDFGLTYGNPDFVKYAESYGARGHRVESAEAGARPAPPLPRHARGASDRLPGRLFGERPDPQQGDQGAEREALTRCITIFPASPFACATPIGTSVRCSSNGVRGRAVLGGGDASHDPGGDAARGPLARILRLFRLPVEGTTLAHRLRLILKIVEPVAADMAAFVGVRRHCGAVRRLAFRAQLGRHARLGADARPRRMPAVAQPRHLSGPEPEEHSDD